MSFLYPRTISVSRMPVSNDINNTNYEGRVPPLTVIASNVRANIQLRGQTTRPATNLPQDVTNDTYWRIFVRSLAAGTVHIRDVITDDLGRQFEVVGDYWNSLGYNILAKRLSS